MRIFINGWFWGQDGTGSGQYLRQLLAHLSDAAPDLQLLLALSRAHAKHGSVDAAAESGCQRLFLTTPFDRFSEDLSKLWFEQVAFPRACREVQADVAHVVHWGSPWHPLVPTVVTIHDLIPLLLPAYRGNLMVRLYTRLVAAAARRAAAVITVSDASRRDIVDHLHLPAGSVHVTHEAAPDNMLRARPSEIEAVRRRYALPDRFFLYLGGFDTRKNVRCLLAAYQQFLGFAPDAGTALVVAGRLPSRDTEFTPDPRRMAAELGIESRVGFPGWVDEADKAALFSAATAFVFPSLYEGFGLPVLEAMACSSPVITSDTSSLPEIVGRAGLLVSPTDVAALAEAMLTVWNDRGLQQSLAQRSGHQAEHFSWHQTAQETLAVYRAVQETRLSRRGLT